ncbi:hypothetical protein U8C32_02565 [Sinorhizobium medicae]|uniref:hypothetical protein n=1 Tax=Sinorhizobium medicae TaxID=110321 RepID=UPI0002EFA43B|nr:hypothetical protein [Sinorhizobium medicae]WQO92526.1 hypothetical protein U8C32_02565 [Sinorhizobium medicae]
MSIEFNDGQHYGFFMGGTTLTSGNGFYIRWSEIVLASLRAAGFLDNMEDGTSPPSDLSKLWLDKNLDPAVLKEWNPVGAAWEQVTSQTLFGRVPWKGEWASSAIYRRADLVSYQGRIWIAIQTSQNHPPAEDAYWDLFLESVADNSVSPAKMTGDFIIQTVTTRTALKEIDTSRVTSIYLKEVGREGVFKWTAGDFSAEVTADTAEALYVKANAVASSSGAWVRVAASDVSAFGASANSDSSAAITAMATLLGYVRFPVGNTLVDADLTIDAPVYFANGAFVTVSGTRTLTITDVIDSPKQHIFRGDGAVSLANDSDSGENARQVHASWFGAFVGKSTDQAPAIQKAFDAVGNSRESVIRFDVGNYLISSGMTATRGALVQGAGTRRTVFLVTSDGYSVFTTGQTACRFADIQFEHHSSVVTNRVSPWITLSHDFCEIERVYMQDAFNQVIVGNGGTNAKMRDINMVWRSYPFTAGSAGILVRAAGCNIDGVFSNYSASGGPAAIIEVGSGASGNVSAPVIDNVNYVCASTGVLIHGDSISVSRGRIANVNYRGSVGNAPQAIKFLTSGTGSVFGFTVDGVEVANTATAAITFQQNSSGTIKEILVDGVYDSGTTGNGIEFIRTAGTLSDIVIGATVNVRLRATPVFFSGSNAGIRIDPRAMVGGDVAGVFFRGSVADDTAFSVALGRQIFSGTAIITAGVVDMGIFGIRAASAPAVSVNRITDANVVAVATSLAGTTGTDGNLTLGVQDGALYVENRTGSAQNISLTVMGA